MPARWGRAEETDRGQIVRDYAPSMALAPRPVATRNHAVAVARKVDRQQRAPELLERDTAGVELTTGIGT
jgi:predicted RNA polymerase sigma factor